MKFSPFTRTAAIALALVGILLPQFSMGADQITNHRPTSDVTLQTNGVLHGFVVDQHLQCPKLLLRRQVEVGLEVVGDCPLNYKL